MNKLLQEINARTPNSRLALVQNQLDAFAPYDDRYTSKTYTQAQLWRAYRLAQFTAAEVHRSIGGKNILSVVLRDPIFSDDAPGN